MADGFRDIILARLNQRNAASLPISPARLANIFANYADISDKLAILRNQGLSRVTSKSDDLNVETLTSQLNEVIRQKEKNDQRLIDTNEKLRDKEKALVQAFKDLDTVKMQYSEMQASCETMKGRMSTLENDNCHLRDEYLALQTTFTMMEQKYRQSVEDNNELRERWMNLKKEQADVLNAENEAAMKRQAQLLQKDIENATKAPISVPLFDEDKFEVVEGEYADTPRLAMCYAPSRLKFKYEAHDSEVNAVCWSHNGNLFVTGGTDRKVKVWEIIDGKANLKGILNGCNQAVTSLDFDSEEKHVLASCNDYAARIWTWSDQRCRSTLTGHSDKVICAKFRQSGQGVITGSHDSTIKLWDIRTVRCLRTLFARSRCNAVVSSDGAGVSIISGHFDKKIRFWDAKSNDPHNEIFVDGRITSLDLSEDGQFVLACTRDDSLKLIDLRTNSVMHTYCGENFRVSTDNCRAALSPDGSFCMAGSSDGRVFIWDVHTTKIEKELIKGGHELSVLACSWQPSGFGVLSSDKHKTVCYWSDY